MRHNLFKFGFFWTSIAIMLGAFGAHGLKNIDPNDLNIFKTAASYHLYGAIITLAVYKEVPLKPFLVFLLGNLIFITSLYISSLTTISLGFLAPIGGLMMIIGLIFSGLGLKNNFLR